MAGASLAAPPDCCCTLRVKPPPLRQASTSTCVPSVTPYRDGMDGKGGGAFMLHSLCRAVHDVYRYCNSASIRQCQTCPGDAFTSIYLGHIVDNGTFTDITN